MHLASVKISGLRCYSCTESVHSSNGSIRRAFQGRFLVPLPIWKLIPINQSFLTNRKYPANTDIYLKCQMKYLTLFFTPARKPECTERVFMVLYRVIAERMRCSPLGMVERNVG